MNTRSTASLIVLVLALSIPMLACAKTRGNEEDEKAVRVDMTATSSESMANNHTTTQYYLTLTTNPPGIASPTGEGWYDAGTNATVSTQEFIEINPGQSRYKLSNWTTPDMSEISNPLTSITSVLVDKTKTVTANYVLQYKITFDQTGQYVLEHNDTIVTIDGVWYWFDVLPASFWYDVGSVHTFYYESLIEANWAYKKAFAWNSTTGLSTAQSGSITVSSSGNVTGNYKTQYYLWVLSPYGSLTPTNGWFDSGTTVVASVNSPISGGTGTRHICSGWSGKGSVPASGSGTATTFQITAPSVLTWKWNTQYYLAIAADPSGLVTIPVEGWYNQSANVTLTAPTVANYDFNHWAVDGASQGNGVNPITATMNATHTAIAYYKSADCDVNGDDKVDMKDVSYVARRFMCIPSDLLWNPTADLNNDEKIDNVDIETVAKHFGEQYS